MEARRKEERPEGETHDTNGIEKTPTLNIAEAPKKSAMAVAITKLETGKIKSLFKAQSQGGIAENRHDVGWMEQTSLCVFFILYQL